MENIKNPNDLIKWAKDPSFYNKNLTECLDEFFKRVNIDNYNPSEFQKNIPDFYERALYEIKCKNELSLPLAPYWFSDALYLRANKLVVKGLFKDAIPYLKKAIMWNPVNRKAIYLLCKIYFTISDYAKAFKWAEVGLEIDYDRKNIHYYFSVLTVYYLKRKDFENADKYAGNMYLLNKDDAHTLKYLESRGYTEVSANSVKNEDIMDALLRIIYDESIITEERATTAQLLLSYEVMPIFKYEQFYLTLESGVKDAEIKDSVIVNGNYLLAGLAEEKFIDVKDKNHLFERLVAGYFDKLNTYNLYLNKFGFDRERYEKEPLLEEIKIKYNGKLYYIANTSTNKEMADLYLEMKQNIIKLATIMTKNKPTVNMLFKYSKESDRNV